MSRLRKAVRRYNQQEEEEEELQLLDSTVQDDIILELKASLTKSKSPSSIFINLIIGTTILMNLMLLTIPYYKKKLNGLLSLLSILCSLINYVILKYEKYEINISRLRLLVISFIISITIIVSKVSQFRILDLAYIVPFLNCIGLYILVTNNGDLQTEIDSLEMLRYNFKEA